MLTSRSISHRNITIASIVVSVLVLVTTIALGVYIIIQSQKAPELQSATTNPQLDALNQALELINTRL